MSRVLIEKSEGVALVTLNDPDRRNAMDLDFCDEIVAGLDEIEADSEVFAVVVTGAGSAFCAGADLSHLGDSAEQGLLAVYGGFLRFGRCSLPTIAAVNGAAVGAGMNLALICDVRIAGESARFDDRFLQLGIHPGGGHTWMYNRVAGPQTTAAAVLFGEVHSGAEAARLGLAHRVVPDDELLEAAHAMAKKCANVPRDLLIRTKQSLFDVTQLATQDSAVAYELGPQVWSTRQPAFAGKLAALKAKITKN